MANAGAWKCIGRRISKMRTIIATILLLFLGISFCVNTADVSFKVLDAIAETYKTFLDQLRVNLAAGTKRFADLPILNKSSSVPSFEIVTITSYNTTIKVSVGIDVSNVYIVAFSQKDQSYFFKNVSDVVYNNLFKGTTKTKLPYEENYDSLETAANKTRRDIPLGRTELSFAITNLWFTDKTKYAKALILIIQMVSEAARFQKIEDEISEDFQGSYKPNSGIVNLETSWDKLSSAIKSSINGVFTKAVTIENETGQPVNITTVVQAKALTGIALLLG